MKRVAITGATSTIGLALVEDCIKQNIEVLAFIQPGSKKRKLLPESEILDVVECSLDDYKNYVPDETNQCEVLFHLAWASTGGDVARNALIPQIKNVEYAVDAVELAQKLGCNTYVGAGSQAEYGRTNEVLTEDTVTKPETAYGIAKLCAGQMTRLACKNKGIKHIWPRILSVYGPNCQPHTVLNYTITELLNGRIPSLSAGEQIWDFIYTSDVARALILLADKGRDGEIYVVGSGQSRLLREYILDTKAAVEQMLGKKDMDIGLSDKPYGENTVMHLECDISKLRDATSFETKVSFEDGIIDTIKWIRNM